MQTKIPVMHIQPLKMICLVVSEMTPDEMERRLDIASSTLLEMLQWDPENVKKKAQVKKYLEEFVLRGVMYE